MTVMDFAALPPEVNSGRMYAGAGSGPMITAAAAWDELASELSSAATSYQSAVSELTGGSWLGSASTSMTAAAAPYVAWMNSTATQAQHTASQARSAASAYETAFVATVPPPVIAANRTLLASLVATNILGQNTAAIAANEAQYGEMWAQDAAAMYGYAGTSAAATQLTPFSSAPQTTNPAATTSQAAAASQAAGTDPISQALLNFLNGPLVQNFETLANLTSGFGGSISGGAFVASGAGFVISPFIATTLIPATAAAQALFAAPAAAAAASDVSGSGLGSSLAGSLRSGATAAGAAGLGGADVSGSLGRAASVGGLSVPQSWGSAAPEIRLAAKTLPMAGPDGLPAAAAGPGGFAGGMPPMGPIGSVVNAPRTGEPGSRSHPRSKIVAQTGAEPNRHDGAQPRWANFDEFGPQSHTPKSEREELNNIRKSIAALAKERDVLTRSAALLIKEATQQ